MDISRKVVPAFLVNRERFASAAYNNRMLIRSNCFNNVSYIVTYIENARAVKKWEYEYGVARRELHPWL